MARRKHKTPAEMLADELWSSDYLRKIVLAELLQVYPWQFSGQGAGCKVQSAGWDRKKTPLPSDPAPCTLHPARERSDDACPVAHP